MPDAVKGTEGAFLRQRRNLILLSTLILFLSVSGARITKDIQILNTTLEVAKLHSLYVAVWFVWWWFFYRYYQYYKQEGAIIVKDAVDRSLTSAVQYRLVRTLEAQQPGMSSSDHGYRSCQTIQRQSFFYLRAQIGVLNRSQTGGQHSDYNWENIELKSVWKDFVSTYYNFLMRRSEFTDYWFPMIYAVAIFVYSYFISDWEGSMWKLVSW